MRRRRPRSCARSSCRYRLLKILEGESLLNDASALLIYRVAVGAAAMEHFRWHAFAPAIVLALAGSLIAGFLFAKLSMTLTRRITDAPSAIIVQFAGTFTVWIVAEHIGLSGILTIVAYAITIARTAPARTPARLRVPSYAVWETAVFVLNVLAFVMIGMQLRPIWERLDESHAAAILPDRRRRSRRGHPDAHRLGDVVQYRVAADDRAPRLSSAPPDGRAHAFRAAS